MDTESDKVGPYESFSAPTGVFCSSRFGKGLHSVHVRICEKVTHTHTYTPHTHPPHKQTPHTHTHTQTNTHTHTNTYSHEFKSVGSF